MANIAYCNVTINCSNPEKLLKALVDANLVINFEEDVFQIQGALDLENLYTGYNTDTSITTDDELLFSGGARGAANLSESDVKQIQKICTDNNIELYKISTRWYDEFDQEFAASLWPASPDKKDLIIYDFIRKTEEYEYELPHQILCEINKNIIESSKEEVDDVDEEDDDGDGEIIDDEWYESDDYTWQVPLMLEKLLELGDDLKNTKDEYLIESGIKYLYKWLSMSDMIQFDCEIID